ncbi:MAG: hypothetical protein WCG31_09725 [Deltaproteobacteria bacterium]
MTRYTQLYHLLVCINHTLEKIRLRRGTGRRSCEVTPASLVG